MAMFELLRRTSKRGRGVIFGLAATVALVFASTASASAPTPPFNQCPAVGFDKSCGTLIVINPGGSVVSFHDSTQGPFDGVEDTMIGVQNNSSATVTNIPLKGSTAPGIFAFDGDGVCSGVNSSGEGGFLPPPAGCPFGPTSYEGPNTSFTISNENEGTVDFLNGTLAPGESTYFSLEGDVNLECTGSSCEVGPSDQPLTAEGQNLSGVEGAEVNGTVATFTDPDTSATAGEYAATIEWGDGSSSAGTVSGSGGSFSVAGSHTYADEGSYAIKVTIVDVDNESNTATTNSTAGIEDAALSAEGVSATSPQKFSGAVANFTDANSGGSANDFTATIEWGDGSSSAGTVSGSGGSYSVNGSHSYTSTGWFEVTVKIVDDGGSTAEAKSRLLIFGTAKGGNFVIGDRNAAIGTAVTFWGAQWWKLNSLSGGSTPISSFKGFEDSPATVACGRSWTTDPGNSTPPPPGPLPAYMLVLVSSKIGPNGARIAGDTVHEVVVKTNPGYAPAAGYAGTGKVVARVC